MLEIICVNVPSILYGEGVKEWNLMEIFVFYKVYLASLKNNSILVINRLYGRISPTVRPDSRIPEKQPG